MYMFSSNVIHQQHNDNTYYICIALPTELSRKHISQMIFKGEMEMDARENRPDIATLLFSSDSDLERVMKEVERRRTDELYTHHPNHDCRKKRLSRNTHAWPVY